MATRIPTASRNAAVDAITALAASGSIEVRTGSQPASASDAETGTLHSTSEHVTVLFDLAARKSTPLDASARNRAEAMLKAHGD